MRDDRIKKLVTLPPPPTHLQRLTAFESNPQRRQLTLPDQIVSGKKNGEKNIEDDGKKGGKI